MKKPIALAAMWIGALITAPAVAVGKSSGHGPQQQHPAMSARLIPDFLATVR